MVQRRREEAASSPAQDVVHVLLSTFVVQRLIISRGKQGEKSQFPSDSAAW